MAALCGWAVDLDLHNKNGDTPLYIALKEIDDAEARFDIVTELLSCGAESKQCVRSSRLSRNADSERPP